MVGILDAQDEKQTPETKKNVLKKMRCLSFRSIAAYPAAKIEDWKLRKLEDLQNLKIIRLEN